MSLSTIKRNEKPKNIIKQYKMYKFSSTRRREFHFEVKSITGDEKFFIKSTLYTSFVCLMDFYTSSSKKNLISFFSSQFFFSSISFSSSFAFASASLPHLPIRYEKEEKFPWLSMKNEKNPRRTFILLSCLQMLPPKWRNYYWRSKKCVFSFMYFITSIKFLILFDYFRCFFMGKFAVIMSSIRGNSKSRFLPFSLPSVREELMWIFCSYLSR